MIVYNYKFHYSLLEVDLPVGSQVIHFDTHSSGQHAIWVLQPTENITRIERRRFKFFGTGQPIPPNYKFVATYQTVFNFVWHLFEEIRDAEPASETTGGN